MRAWKLLRKRKDETYGPLFIHQRLKMLPRVWYVAEDHPTKGYAHRPGFHCLLKPEAPHLTEKKRVWCEVEIGHYKYFTRPEAQGGRWVLAQQMQILEELIHLMPKNPEYKVDHGEPCLCGAPVIHDERRKEMLNARWDTPWFHSYYGICPKCRTISEGPSILKALAQ